MQLYEHEGIYCHVTDKSKLNDMDRYLEAPTTKTWLPTCTKFAAWKLTQYDRIVFLDSDTLVVKPIDHVLWTYSNASFVAAPEIFPPDTFNSGVMVLTPSLATFRLLLQLNQDIGSNDGGDQGVLNRGLCPNWYTADSTDPHCARLPWRYNVEYHLFTLQHIYTTTTQQPVPAVLHYIGLKPWKVLQMDYTGTLDPSVKARLLELTDAHLLWRDAFFRGSGEEHSVPPTSLLYGVELSPRTALDYHMGGRDWHDADDVEEREGQGGQHVRRSGEGGDRGQGGKEGEAEAHSKVRRKTKAKAKVKGKVSTPVASGGKDRPVRGDAPSSRYRRTGGLMDL